MIGLFQFFSAIQAKIYGFIIVRAAFRAKHGSSRIFNMIL